MDAAVPFAGLYELPATLGAQPFSFSPDSLEDDADDLGGLSDNDNDNEDGLDQVDPASGPKRKSRRPPSTAEKRANHNAIERARRESLNGRFMDLARLLPNMNANKRPSKNTIVSKSLEFVKGVRAREQALEAQNAALRTEVAQLRSQLGPAGRAPEPIATPALAVQLQQQQQQPAVEVAAASAVARPASAMTATSQGPYLPHDPIAAATAYYSYIDAQRNLAASSAVGRRDSSSSTSPRDETSDSEASFIQTPPSSASFSPYYYEEPSSMSAMSFSASSLGAADELYGCGLQSISPSVTTAHIPGAPTSWAGMGGIGINFGGGAAIPYSLYA